MATKFELDINATHETIRVDLDPSVREAMRAASHGNVKWGELSTGTRKATDNAMCAIAAEMSAQDRAFPLQGRFPTMPIHWPFWIDTAPPRIHAGGVMLVAANRKHQTRLLEIMKTRHSGISAGTFDDLANLSIGCVVVTQSQDRGYDGGIRLGGMVTGVYPGNSASRIQMRGRIRRIGQKRSLVQYATVVMKNSVLDLLHERHNCLDTAAKAIEDMAESFTVKDLENLIQRDNDKN